MPRVTVNGTDTYEFQPVLPPYGGSASRPWLTNEIVEPSPGKSCNAPKNVGEKSIKGRALCPSSDRPEIRELYNKYCLPADGEPPSGPGGCDYGVRAQRVVLVK